MKIPPDTVNQLEKQGWTIMNGGRKRPRKIAAFFDSRKNVHDNQATVVLIRIDPEFGVFTVTGTPTDMRAYARYGSIGASIEAEMAEDPDWELEQLMNTPADSLY